jgi:hypothetical protein
MTSRLKMFCRHGENVLLSSVEAILFPIVFDNRRRPMLCEIPGRKENRVYYDRHDSQPRGKSLCLWRCVIVSCLFKD